MKAQKKERPACADHLSFFRTVYGCSIFKGSGKADIGFKMVAFAFYASALQYKNRIAHSRIA